MRRVPSAFPSVAPSLHASRSRVEVCHAPGRSVFVAGQSLTSKLIERARSGGDDELLALTVDQVLLEDATGIMAALQYEPLGSSRCEVELAVCYVDHNVLQIDQKNKEDHRFLQAFCR